MTVLILISLIVSSLALRKSLSNEQKRLRTKRDSWDYQRSLTTYQRYAQLLQDISIVLFVCFVLSDVINMILKGI